MVPYLPTSTRVNNMSSIESHSWISKEVELVNTDCFLDSDIIKKGDRGFVTQIVSRLGFTHITVNFYGKGRWILLDWRLRLVKDICEEKNSKIPSCPRCSGSLVSKETHDPFTNERFMVDKCNSCGWC